MQVILLQRVDKLGLMGQVVDVKPGYARNFLLPQKKAMRANKANLAHFDAQKIQLEAQNLKHKEEATFAASKMNGMMMTLIRQASETGQLFGSVRPSDVSESMNAQKVKVSRGQVVLIQPIKTLGIHDVHVVLHPEVRATVRVNIAKSEEEAVVQAEKFQYLAQSVLNSASE